MSVVKCIYLNTDTNTASGLFKSQVLSLEKNAPENFDLKVVNVANINRWLNRPADLPNIIGFPMRHANTLVGIVLIYLSAIFAAFQIVIRFRNIDVIVARGYYGGLIGLFLILLGRKFIWDPRSVYPLEMLGKGFFSRDSYAFRFWVWIEGCVVEKASSVFVVSEGHRKYMSRVHKIYKAKGKLAKVALIPCYASSDYSEVSDDRLIEFCGRSLGSPPIVCYLGSLDNGWNNIVVYAKVFREVLVGGGKLLIITQSVEKEELIKYFAKPLTEKELRCLYVTEVQEPGEQMAVLRQCDYGVMYMEKVPDWFTRMSVKFAMYRCAGLPVIINRYFGGALQVLKSQNDSFSRVINKENDKVERLQKLTEDSRVSIIRQASALFSQQNFYCAVCKAVE